MLGEGDSEGDWRRRRGNFCRELRLERTDDDGAVSGGADTAAGSFAELFPFWSTTGMTGRKGMRCVACQICEKECPPKCIYIEKSKDKKPDYVRQAADLSSEVRYRYFGVHELPDLC